MPKRMKAKWIKALRSGKYEQGQEYLMRDEKYCCLGVLGDIHPKWNWSQLPETELQMLVEGNGRHEENYIILPEKAQASLVKKNDSGWGFNRIATWIEKNL